MMTKRIFFMSLGPEEQMHHLYSVHVFQNTDAIKSILINQMDVHEEEPVIDTKPAVNLKEVGHR